MKCAIIFVMATCLGTAAAAQQLGTPGKIGSGATALTEISNLPVERIGRDDLVGITVYDAPELTRTVRINSDGDLRLPMLKKPVHAAGLYPAELESVITKALVDEDVLVEPIVTVSVVEYRSRPITVVGSVKNPLTFQATGTVTLLDALSQAQGLTENAGSEILVSHQPVDPNGKAVALTDRISVHELLSGKDPSLNIRLEGGEQIRVPEAGRIFVVGNVKRPGAFYITNGSESSVLKALALSEGLDTFTSSMAYIYRLEGANNGRNEIPIELKKILHRKSPDVALQENDILYIPDATGVRAGLKALETSLALGTALGAASIYAFH